MNINLDTYIKEAEAALEWRGNYDTELKCLDPWTFAKVRRVEEALKSLLKEIKNEYNT